MTDRIPENVKLIITTLESAGYEAYIVGGCVRDIIMGTEPVDWDIATSATPSQSKALFLRTVDTGLKHGTITVLLGVERYEVTTYRIDGIYLDGRRPESVEFTRDIHEDLSRRDFSINAIAFSPTHGFIDPFHGREHIETRLIKCVGQAAARFEEDALRMLRAIRFAAVLGFVVDKDIIDAATSLRENLKLISPERIRDELMKSLQGTHPQALTLLESTGIMPFVLRGRKYGGDLPATIERLRVLPGLTRGLVCQGIAAMNLIQCRNDMGRVVSSLALALFLSWSGEECEGILRDLHFDNKTIKYVSLCVRLLPKEFSPDRYEIKKLLKHLVPNSLEVFENLLILKAANGESPTLLEALRRESRDIAAKNECFTLRDLDINGDDLAKAGISTGKAMGETLEALLDTVMKFPNMNKKALLLTKLHQ